MSDRGMKRRRHVVPAVPVFAAIATGLFTISWAIVTSRSVAAQAPGASLVPAGQIDPEEPAGGPPTDVREAPTGFDNQSNGAIDQGSFDANRGTFEEVETIADGLGPTYNAQSCRECHQNVVTGGASQLPELRSGLQVRGQFFASQGGTLIEARAIDPDIVAHVGAQDNVQALRISTNTLGDGFVECITNAELLRIRDAQPAAMQGLADIVPVLEANSVARIGRFGWKSQHASLFSFASDAYLNEMGITNPLFPAENPLANGLDVSKYDHVPDPEDNGADVQAFTNFMRATKAPSRGAITAAVTAGESVFNQIGCATCHTPAITTAAPATPINGGQFVVPDALGAKVIHPYSDFLLHDIGTGDGIPVQPTSDYAATANKMRTAPLWGLRTRNRLMHDGLSYTVDDAVNRHSGQATAVKGRYLGLSPTDKGTLLAFLKSL